MRRTMGAMITPAIPTAATAPRTGRHLRATDLRAAALLATQATHAVTTMAEGVHQAVWRTLGAPSGTTRARTRGLTALVYQSIHGITGLVGRGLSASLRRLEPLLERLETAGEESPERLAVVSALNGVMGDRLAAGNNPLAVPMTLHFKEHLTQESQGLKGDFVASQGNAWVGSKLLLVIHGLCMNDLQWNVRLQGQTVNHAQELARALGYTPVYLRYNTGLHISQNGHELARQLEALTQRWPVALQSIAVLAHSMGGLVIRSALHEARQTGLTWPDKVKDIGFLGTPHYGAPLERAGNWVDVLLGSTPYSRPLAKIGQLRSAGVTDLRYGLLRDADWQGHDRFRQQPDRRTPLLLPTGVNCFAVAATLTSKRGPLADRLSGDGLVPLRSALGEHDAPQRHLHFAPERQFIVYRTSHLQLLSSAQVTQRLLDWLGK